MVLGTSFPLFQFSVDTWNFIIGGKFHHCFSFNFKLVLFNSEKMSTKHPNLTNQMIAQVLFFEKTILL